MQSLTSHMAILTCLLFISSTQIVQANTLLSVDHKSLCSPKKLTNRSTSFPLSFTGEKLSIGAGADYFKNTLFVGTHFFVSRAPKTFTNERLMSSRAIAKLSESSISRFKVTDNSNSDAQFQSSKKLPFFNQLNCSNRVQLYSWQDYSNQEEMKPFLDVLKKDKCLDAATPFKVSQQEVFDCNDHFTRSTIITFYFDENATTSRILTYSFSEMTGQPNFIKKRVMKGEIEKSLQKVKGIIEGL